MKIYIVVVNPGNHISQVAYDSIEKAQKFVERREDKPQKITGYKYQSNTCEYLIYDLVIERAAG